MSRHYRLSAIWPLLLVVAVLSGSAFAQDTIIYDNVGPDSSWTDGQMARVSMNNAEPGSTWHQISVQGWGVVEYAFEADRLSMVFAQAFGDPPGPIDLYAVENWHVGIYSGEEALLTGVGDIFDYDFGFPTTVEPWGTHQSGLETLLLTFDLPIEGFLDGDRVMEVGLEPLFGLWTSTTTSSITESVE